MDVFPQFQRESFRKTVRDGSERERERETKSGEARERARYKGERQNGINIIKWK